MRKVATTIRNSIFQLFLDKISEYGIYSEFNINKSEMRFTHVPTGNEIILHGMDDQEKIKSIAGITSVWCEEATELDEIDFNQLELRVRGETTNYKQFIVTFNPISETHWLKARFFDVPDVETMTLTTTYKDNCFLDDDYVKHLTERVKANANLYKVYVLGEWGKVDFGGEFLKSWSTAKHTKQLEYDPSLAIWLSVDENVNPYFPCGVFQVTDNNEIRLIHEFALKNPRNTVDEMARSITTLLKVYKHQGAVYLCGDATSQKDDVKIEKGYDLFRLLISKITDYNVIRRVPPSNPNVRPSADFVNAILEYNEQGISFVADERCRTSILDYENTKEDKNGKVDKKTVRDSITGVTYQPYGHMCFVGDTKIITSSGEKQIKDVSENDYVLTRNGYQKVLVNHNNGLKKVNTYIINGNKITCTNDHLIYTYNFGYIEIQKVVTLSMYLDIFICIFDSNKNICKQKLSITQEGFSQDTHTQKTEQRESILLDGHQSMVNSKKLGITFINTCSKLATYLKVITYTTKMKIHRITNWIIWNVLMVGFILAIMLKKSLQMTRFIKQNFMQQVLKLLRYGIKVKKVENGTQTLHTKGCKNVNLEPKNVLFATKSTKQKLYKAPLSFAQIIASLRIGEKWDLIILQSNVSVAKMILSKTNTQQKNIAQDNVQQVYDLTVENNHEYFANNVLFHNCDALRYLITTIFSSEYDKFQRGSLEVKAYSGRDYDFKSSNRF